MPAITHQKVLREEAGNRHIDGFEESHGIWLVQWLGLGKVRVSLNESVHVELLCHGIAMELRLNEIPLMGEVRG